MSRIFRTLALFAAISSAALTAAAQDIGTRISDSAFRPVSYSGPCCTGCFNDCGCGTTTPSQAGTGESAPGMMGPSTGGMASVSDGGMADLSGQGSSLGSIAASDTIGGYIDPVSVRTRLRVRYDHTTGGNSDRAEFLYAAYSQGNNVLGGKNNLQITKLNYDEISEYFEYSPWCGFSAFVELPERWDQASGLAVNGGNLNASGLADMNAGIRYALVDCEDQLLTFQLKVYAPTGNVGNALGNGHASLMPGLLFQEKWSDRITVFGELDDWIGLDGTNSTQGKYTGNVLRYGVGSGYDLYVNDCGCKTKKWTVVSELVGWTVLSGLETDAASNTVSAKGDTIVNGKIGLRYTEGQHSLYAGYGRHFTDKVWYDDIVRVQYDYNF